MKQSTKIALSISAAALAGFASYMLFFRKHLPIKSLNQAMNTGFAKEVLWKVIAREGESKNYGDLIPLDGGTVGIAHFAVGGLSELYETMDTEKYFGKSKDEMIANYSNSCRPSGKSGNDTGWGCYSQPFWKDGMKKFLSSKESKSVQTKAWLNKMSKVITNAINHNWTSRRQLAIALGVANSLGAGGFNKLASANNWDAEKTLIAYAGDNDHRRRRMDAINKNFK